MITERISLENQMTAAKHDADKAEADACMALQAQREHLARAGFAAYCADKHPTRRGDPA